MGDDVGQGEGIAAEHVDVFKAERVQAGYNLVAYVEVLGPEPVQRRIHVDRVPQHHDIDR